MKKWCAITSIFIAMLLATSCALINPTPPSGELKILDHSLTRGDSGSAEVQVKVKNAGSSTIELAQVKVNFYDAQGEPH